MKKCFGALIAAVFAVLGASGAGESRNGDIRSVEAVGNASAGFVYPNQMAPHRVGETFYILVRLLNEDHKQPTVHEWQLKQSVSGTVIGDYQATVYWPGLRIAIGSERVTAQYTTEGPDGMRSGPNGEYVYYTDLYFKYTVKEGQLGLPVHLVDSQDKIIDAEASGLGQYSLQFVNVNTVLGLTGRYWDLINDQGTLAEFWFGPTTPDPEPAGYPSAPSGGQHLVTKQLYPGVFVQTIDFHQTFADEDAAGGPIWRDVYQGLSDSVGLDPSIIGTADEEGAATTVYVWSEDENIVSIDGVVGETVSYEVQGVPVTHKVYPISLTSSGIATFKLKGGISAPEGSVTNIVLCATKKPAINAAGEIVAGSTVTRRIRVIGAPDPFITLSDAEGNRVVPLEATSAYTTGTRMKMTFSKSFDASDVKVKLLMNVGTTTIDPVAEKYIFISDSDGADPESTPSLTEITMPKGEREAYFYVYALGTCKELKTTGVTITNLIDQAAYPDAYDQFKEGAHRGVTLKITDQKPVVTASMPSTGFKNDKVNVDVMISDNWRDLSTNNTNGYRVVIYLGGTKVCDTNGVTFSENEQVSFPIVIPAEGNPLRGTVQVWDQMNNSSESAEIFIEAKAPLTVVAGSFSSTDASAGVDSDPTYAEGQTVYLRAVLSSASATEMYAFIVPLDQASSNLISTTATTNGLKITTSGAYAQYSDYARVKLLDGDVEGRKVNLGIVLKDRQDWNDAAGNIVSTYSSGGTWTLTVTNVPPRFSSEGVWGGEDTNRIEVANGATYMGKVSATTPVQFNVKIADPGIVDLTNGTARVKWIWTDGPADERYVQNMITTVDTNGIARATITFDEENVKQTVTLQVQDRDMFKDDPGAFSSEQYKFTVTVGYVPTVIIEYPNGTDTFSETANAKMNYVTVKVSEWPTASVEGRERLGSSNPLQVRVSLPTAYHPNDNAALHLTSNGVVQIDDDEGVVVTFKTARAATKDGVKVYFDLNTQNGGSGPNEDPSEYIIYGAVITETMASTDQKWSEYYASVEQPIKLNNEHPTLNVTVADTHEWAGYEGGTNEWTAGEKVKLKWEFTDIAPDVTNDTASISWTIIDVNNKRSVKVKDAVKNITFDGRSPCKATASGEYEFTVPSSEYTLVTVTARDGNGGEAVYTFSIHVIPTKDVIVIPCGPSTDSSSKYGSAPGLGWGHIYVENSTGQYTMRQFAQTWMYSETATKASLFAAGYPAAATNTFDDGNLGIAAGFNKAAEPNSQGGKWTTGQERFNFKSDFDSYFYCWLYKGADETTMTVQPPAPATSPSAAQSFYPSLDNEKEEGTGYSQIEVQAIFSRELYASDNLGDINADGIPDVIVKNHPGFGIYADDGSLQGNDMVKLTSFNDDGDYLPAGENAVYTKFLPGTSADWIENGVPFSARLEVRGWNQNLNDAAVILGVKRASSERRYTDPRTDTSSTLSEIEYLAFLCWSAKNGKDATAEETWKLWSPENPTDPTLADSDDDGVPDGYEYYIWYRAHVGYIDADGEYRRFEGRKYNELNPAEPIKISPEAVEAIYNPNVPNDALKYADTDGDGITDLVEIALGTNPLDFDSDGDGLPDGFEVFITESDPLLYSSINSVGGDGAANPDNDAKAELVLDEVPVIGVKKGSGVERFALIYGEIFSVTNIPYGKMTLIGYVSPDGLVTNTYVTSEADVSYSKFFGTEIVEGKEYLAKYLPATTTFKCTIQGDTVILGENVSLDPGMPVTFHVEDVDVVECELLETPVRAHSVWKYNTAGKLVLGQEMYGAMLANFLPEGAKVVEPIAQKSVALLHHHVYQYHGLAKENKDGTRRVWVDSKAFDPRTAWRIAGGVETSLFTHYDEFMYPIFIHRDTYYYASGSTLWAGGYALSSRDLTPSRDAGTRVALWQKFCTNPNNADTDGDGTPDGWEAYLFAAKPQYISDDESPYKGERAYNYRLRDSEMAVGSPLYADGTEKGFTRAEEFAGVESTAAYADCETILAGNIHPEWTNKKWPTDPNQEDTDGDGISDAEEMTHFLYGPAVGPGSGGGLNPLSWDTDLDGLPDPWEVQFAGIYTPGETSTSSSVTVDQTTGVTNNTITVTRGEGSWSGGMDGTTDDARLDYDNDGLLNWQEYLVGAMRCWRYDDTISSWDSHYFDPEELGFALSSTNEFNRYFSERLLSDGGEGLRIDGQHENYNPRIMVHGHFDPSSSYFSYCENSWDPAYGGWYMFADGINHDLKNPGEEWQIFHLNEVVQCNRFTWRPFLESMVLEDDNDPSGDPLIDMSIGDGGKVYYFGKFPDYIIYPTKYICCDPTKKDTDNDAMDDYYELYHGMNPLLGAAGQIDNGNEPALDIVFIAYDGIPGGKPKNQKASATRNYWMGQPKPHHRLPARKTSANNYDFEAYPWLNGLAAADADGDNLRNQTEAIMTDMQGQSTWLHSDPTPLWMTDFGYSGSLTYRYYIPTETAKFIINGCPSYFTDPVTTNRYYFNDFPGFHWEKTDDGNKLTISPCKVNRWNALDVAWSFEENEGYDTDHDYLSDYDEVAGKTKSSSDVRNSDSPLRRQAMWFPGEDAFLETTIEVSEVPPRPLPTGVDLPFFYYTVECWAKPEGDLTREQTVVERAIYTGPSNLGDAELLRKNFLIGLKNGRWYTKYDSAGTDKNDPQEILNGPEATTNWTHVAATFDGEYLCLYINGTKYRQLKTGVQPEHGTSAVAIDAVGKLKEGTTGYSGTAAGKPVVLIGASVNKSFGIAFDAQWRWGLLFPVDFTYYKNYYQGYVDEVRIWDGARSESEIRENYRKRFTREDALANRQAVWEVWKKGITNRAPSTKNMLPAELKRHWNFDHIPGAATSEDIMATPAGFDTAFDIGAKAVWSRPIGWVNPWWNSVFVKSTNYSNTAWVPWISDTVGHLPRMDGTTVDSKYWSEDLLGGKPAAQFNYAKFDFPRTMEPYSRARQVLVGRNREGESDSSSNSESDDESSGGSSYYGIDRRLNWVENDPDKMSQYVFTMRHRLLEGFDLLPLGGAYPKRISAAEGGMWDDGTAADAWAQTGADTNNDNLPDWWSNHALLNYNDSNNSLTKVTWTTDVYYNGVKMPAWQAYLRDLAAGMLSDGVKHPEFADTRDLDGDGIPDWWEDLYKIDTGSKADATADPDNDGLSNYKEYIISERDRCYPLDPTLSHSVSEDVVDYFLQIKNEKGENVYLGEVYADHDFMEDLEEDANGLDRTRYDANTDADEDGWSAWSEMRYSNYKQSIAQKFVSHLAGSEEVKDYPVPVVHATLRYNGTKVNVGSTAPIVIQAYSGGNLQNEPSATYNVTPGAAETRYVYLGFYDDRVVHGTLTPGWIVNSLDTISLEVAHAQPNDKFSWTIKAGEGDEATETIYTGTYEEMWKAWTTYGKNCVVSAAPFEWQIAMNSVGTHGILQISSDDQTMKGYMLLDNKRVGTIDLVTGDFDLNLKDLQNYIMADSLIALPQHFFRIAYQAKIPAEQTKCLNISLATPDKGSLTEGTASFVAFIDIDGNGEFTPGVEPIGIAKDVAIGWDQVPSLSIEMTDTSVAAGKRFAFGDDVETLRIIRTSINGEEEGVKRRIVYSRTASDVKRKTVYEGDLLTNNKFGLDWTSLRADIMAMEGVSLKDVATVGYTVVSGEGSVQNIASNDVIDTFIVEYASTPTKPTAYSPSVAVDGTIVSARPEFKWTSAAGYTAFRLQIWEEGGAEAVYNSPLMALPPADASGRFIWTAPVFIGTNSLNDAWVLNNNSSYKWRVAMYNAKFSNTNEAESVWSDFASFKTKLAEANDFSTRRGTATVSVRYFGPATNALSSVIVQLFRNADFSGVPAAQSRLMDSDFTAPANSLTNAVTVSFCGLDEDEYFAVAFIDRNGNAVRDAYETWGYSAQVGASLPHIWTPSGAKVDPSSAKAASVDVYMEDTDVNRDGVLDWNQAENILTVAASATASGSDTSDVDLDGLTGDEETGDTYTNKQKWDTDGDGLPDGWEARFADTDPLLADADTLTKGDYMAFTVTNGIYRMVTNKDGIKYLVRDTNSVYRVGDVIPATVLITTYDYMTIVPDETLTNTVTVTYAGLGTNILAGADFQIDAIANVDVALVHAQVYDEFGYSQSTAIDPADKNTKAFTALDKYMLVRYFAAIGFTAASEEAMNLTKAWKDFTLKPNDTDNDRDGVADGWELYLMFGTNTTAAASQYATPSLAPINPWKYADRDTDLDADGLSLVDEYAQGKNPSDPWNKYSVYDELLLSGVVPSDAAKFTDARARRFGITAEDYDDDWDIDLISNVQEMWAYYRDMDSLADIDPENAWSDGVTPDYFRPASGSYLGAIYNGGEFVEPAARAELEIADLRNAGTRDLFQSGWDVWSIVRYTYAEQLKDKEEEISEELSIANKYTYVMFEGYEGVTEAELVDFHVNQLGHTEEESLGAIIAGHGGIEAMKRAILEKSSSSLETSNFSIPEPQVNFTFKWAGNGQADVVVDVWQKSSFYPEYGEQLTASYTAKPAFDAGVAYVRAKTAARGTIKQGPARFVAYIDENGDGKCSPGEVFGTSEAVVGYSDIRTTIRLGAYESYTYPLVRVNATNENSVVALVRSKINGEPLMNQVAGAVYFYLPNNQAREAVYPVEYFTSEHTGLDKYLAEHATSLGYALENIEEVTYEIVHIKRGDLASLNVTNLNNYVVVSNGEVKVFGPYQVNEEFTVRYSNTRDKAKVWGTADSTVGNVTISFTVPTDGYANTRFWLVIDGATHKGKYGNGFLIPPAADGVVVLDQNWFDEQGISFNPGKCKVKVLLGNDKFGFVQPTTDEWSEEATFSINKAAERKGKIAVNVVHPLGVAFTEGVSVAVYDTEDLAEPVAYVDDKASTSAIEVTGLREGSKYYVAAWYVKDSADGRVNAGYRAPYDTWGYLTSLGSVTNGFTAMSVVAAETVSVTNTIYLQDTDWNDNGIVDREEDFIDHAGIYDVGLTVGYNFQIEGAEEIEISDVGPIVSTTAGVMAYAKVPFQLVSVTNGNNEAVWYAVLSEPASSNVTSVGIAVGTPLSELKLASTYYYGDSLALGTNVTFAADANKKVVSTMKADLVLVHAQVLDFFGFDSRTANGNMAHGDTLNTKEFTSRDKKYLVDYLRNVLGVTNATEYALSDTLVDADAVEGGQGDGLPDGWELYMMFKPDGIKDGLICHVDDLTDGKVVFSPWNYNDRNSDIDGDGLSNLLEYDGGAEPTNPFDPDTDGDNISDFYAWKYMLKGGEAERDADGDGLSNYAEYLISEVFQFHSLDPRNARTDGACVDYFRKVGHLYLGELFTDHDQVSDLWEAAYPGAPSLSSDLWANRYIYDPEKDLDGDGWSNYAEAKAGTSPKAIDSIGVDQETLAEHPVPVIEATVVYNGYDPISGPLVFRAWSEKFDPGMMHAADAIWTTPTATGLLTAKKYIGMKPSSTMVYSLGPGAVTPGSVKLYFRDPSFRRAVVRNNVELSVSEAGVSQAKWYALVQDKNGELVTTITNQVTAVSVGSIDYTTGKVEINFNALALSGSVYASMVNASHGNEAIDADTAKPTDYYNCEKINLDASYVKIAWSRMSIGSNIGGTYYLGDPDKSGAVEGNGGEESGDGEQNFSAASRGYVREGLNSFVVFADQNHDGDYTAGEPFGYVNGVDVGWQGAKFTVELTETSPVFARVNVKTEENDRVALYGIYSDTIIITNLALTAGNENSGSESGDGGLRYLHVRVDRHSVNGVQLGIGDNKINLPDRILVDKYMDLGVRSFLHEGDFISEGEFDIDWSYFDEIAYDSALGGLIGTELGPDPVEVGYRVVVDNSLLVSPVTNNISLSYVFTRRFDSYDNRAIPVDLANVVTYGSRPTFSWSMGKSNTYTAFRLQIRDGTNVNAKVVYDSGINRAPAKNREGRYEWTAPIAPGDVMPTGETLEANGNYWWYVSMYNSKFNWDAYSKEAGVFRTLVNAQQDVDDRGYNAIAVTVKYTGPEAVLTNAAVRLEAFTTADFSGENYSRVVVTNKADIADSSKIIPNAKLIGLPAGTYYVRAYIDSNNNFKKDVWESWGSVAESVTVGAGIAMPNVGLYIEDADTDDDWVPDALEYAQSGRLDANDAKALVSGEFILSDKLSGAVNAGGFDAGVSTTLSGVTLSAFQYADAMSTLLLGEMSGEKSSLDAIRAAVEKTIKGDSVKITSITFDPTKRKVVLTVDAEVADSIAGKLFSKIYDFTSPDSVAVTVKVYKKDSLVQANWTLVETKNCSIGKTEQYVEVGLSGNDYTSGFYKVEIEQ